MAAMIRPMPTDLTSHVPVAAPFGDAAHIRAFREVWLARYASRTAAFELAQAHLAAAGGNERLALWMRLVLQRLAPLSLASAQQFSDLAARIAARFERMLASGAAEEVAALMTRKLDPTLPAMKAIGVPEISDWLAGRLTREQAIERAVIATRQFAKRQRTWFRGRMADWTWRESLALP